MATPRTEKSTIPADKNPLAGVSYRRTSPSRPIDSLISDTTKEAKKEPTPEPRRKSEPQQESQRTQKARKGQGNGARRERPP